MNYRQLSLSERNLIYLFHCKGTSIRKIAKYLLRNPSTISRELQRVKTYDPTSAHEKYLFNKQNANMPNLDKYSEFIKFFIDNFDKKTHSPDVLVGVARKNGMKTPCTKTLYHWINLGLLKIKKYHLLRSSNKYKRRQRIRYNKPSKLHRVPISMRKRSINERKDIGHWEVDSVTMSRNPSRTITIVERVSRLGITLKNETGKMYDVWKQIEHLVLSTNLPFKSMTFDNGSEFNECWKLKNINVKVYYCHPYSPSERGTNEIWNGFFRRFFPKGTDFTKVTQEDLDKVTEIINKTPRRLLGYESSLDVMLYNLNSVALATTI